MVLRKVLNTNLNEALGHTPHTAILSGPPGYGKTTFARSWIEQQNITPIWLTLDKYDNDPIRFFSYLTAAASKVENTLGEALHSLLAGPRNPSPESFAISFNNETSKLKQKLVCIFDDYHTITNKNIHIFMQTLIDNLNPHLFIVILGRFDPPLTLGRMRLQNRLSEFRIEDLKMSSMEMEEFFDKTMDIPLSKECYTLLENKIEGWPAGLLLAALSVIKTPDKEAEQILNEVTGRHTYIIEYLTEEVLNGLTDDLRRFLYTTSVLNSFCAELCDAVMLRSDSHKILKNLVELNIFLLSMDHQGQWYRYHPLFANYLQTNINDEQKNRIFISAYQWFQSKNIIESAVSYAIKAGKEELMLPTILDEAEKIFIEGKYSTLLSWLDLFSPRILKEKPELFFFRAWGTFSAGSIEKAIEILTRIERVDNIQISRKIAGRIDVLKALIAEAKNEENKIDLIKTALKSISPGDRYLQAIIIIQNGKFYFNEQNLEKAEIFFLDALEIAIEILNPFLIAVSVFNLSYVYIKLGREEDAISLCEKYLKESTMDSGSPSSIMTILYIPLAVISSESETGKIVSAFTRSVIESVIHFNFNFLLIVNISTAVNSLMISSSPSVKEITHHETDHVQTTLKDTDKSDQYILTEPISRRESDILELLCKGFSNNGIAEGLFISEGTVKWHLNNIFGKLNVTNRTQAVNRARDLHLLKN